MPSSSQPRPKNWSYPSEVTQTDEMPAVPTDISSGGVSDSRTSGWKPPAASFLPAGFAQRLVADAICSPGGPVRTAASPCDGSILGDIPQSTAGDVARAFEIARTAQPRWAATSLAERRRILLRFHDLLLANREQGLDLLQVETGKSRREALEELLDVCVQTRFIARNAARLLEPRRKPGVFPLITRVEVHRQPVGVVGIIAPWNYPLTLPISDALPALMTGNAAVLKPDSQTPLTALWAIDLLYQAGLPPRVFPVVLGPGASIGPEIVARADFVMFTGSTNVGHEVAAACGQRLIGVSMELGGKNPMIVCGDADMVKAADVAIRSCVSNAGQTCVSVERIYVVEKVYEQFLEAFISRLRTLRLGTGPGWGYDMGSLTGAKQLATVCEHVADALAKGAKLEFGGRVRTDLGPYVHEPTVLTGVIPTMLAHSEETFGPVVSVYSVANPSEAVALSNESTYGLHAVIVTGDPRFGRDLAAKLRVGTVTVNEGHAAAWAAASAPMGGMRDSGLGRRHGDTGLAKYTEEQTVAVQRLLGFGAPFGMSDKRFGSILTAAIAGMKWLGKS